MVSSGAYSASEFKLSPIKAIEIAASKIARSVSLAQGIPSFATPDCIRDFVFERVRAGMCDKYSLTNGLLELREEISLTLQREGIYADPERDIIVTAGSIEGITASLLALTEPGDEVLLPSPTYTSYIGALHVARCMPKFVPLNEERNFEFDLHRLEKAISDRTKVLLYCSPNNPTGTIYHEQNIRGLCALAQKHGLIVIIDEVYKDFYYVEQPHFSPAQLAEMREHVVRVCSFSKAFAMTGWRVGFLATNDHFASQILKYHDAMVTCAPVVSQYAGLAALRYGEPFLKMCQESLRRRREFTIQKLDELSQLLDYQVPQATYFVFPRVKDTVPFARDSHRLAYDILEKTGLALVPGVAFGPTGESHLRINFGRSDEELTDGLGRFAEYLTHARAPRHSAPHSQRQSTTRGTRGWIRRCAAKLLGVGARLYLHRNSPTIIGIVGARGKTVAKRVITEALARKAPTRMSILSYNTEIGLPLSVLQLTLPRSVGEFFSFARRYCTQSFLARSREQFLVLEYGFGSADEAKTLLDIVRPDWLVLTGLSQLDPSIPSDPFIEGVNIIASAVSVERIIWPADDCKSQELSSALLERNSIKLPDEQSFETTYARHVVASEHRTEGARFALGAASLLLSMLNVGTDDFAQAFGLQPDLSQGKTKEPLKN